MKLYNKIGLFAISVASLLTATSCSNEKQNPLTEADIISSITVYDADGFQLKSEDEVPVVIGKPVKLTVKVTPEDMKDPVVKYTVTDGTIASATGDGVVTGLIDGKTVLTITPEVGFGTEAAVVPLKLNVVTTPVNVEDIVISNLPEKLFIGESADLSATVLPENATFKRLKYEAVTNNVTVTPEGKVTGAEKGEGVVRVKSTDGTGYYKDFTIMIDKIVPVVSATITNKPGEAEAGEYTESAQGETYQLTYSMTPADASAFTLQWSSSDESVATVDANGKVKFLSAGVATIKLLCPSTGNYDEVKFNVGEGYIREEFNNEGEYTWGVQPAHIKQGAVETWNPGFLHCTTYVNNKSGRADFYSKLSTTVVHAGKYPILAIKMTNPAETHKAQGVTQCRITLDCSLGAYGNSYNKYQTYDAGDGVKIYYYNLATGTFGSSASKLSTSEATPFKTLQFKVADIKTIEAPVDYKVYWVRTFKSEDDMKAFADAHKN